MPTENLIQRTPPSCGGLVARPSASRALWGFAVALLSIAVLTGCQSTEPRFDSPKPWGDAPPPVRTNAEKSSQEAEVNSLIQAVSYQSSLDEAADEAAEADGTVRPAETAAPLATPMPESLGLLDLEGLALQNSPALAEQLALVDAADGHWWQAGLPPNPTLGYSGQQLGSGGVAEQQGIYFGQKIIRGDKLQLGREVASWETEVAQQGVQATRLRLLTDVRIAYYRMLVAQQREKVASELVTLSERAAAVAHSLFVGEEVSEADPLRAKVAADSARLVQYKASSQLLEAKRRMSAIIGMPELLLSRVKGQLDTDGESIDWDQTLHKILSESPEMAAAAARVEVAEWALERAHADAIPDVDIQAVIQDDRGAGGANGNIQVSMPIPIRNRNEGAIRGAHAEVSAAHMAVDRLRLELQTRLASVFQQYDAARNRAAQFVRKDGMIETSKKTIELIRAGYEIEEFSILDLLSAQRTLFEARLNYLDSLGDLWVAQMEIEGMLLSSKP
jgi:cobalt-zinc-cadmium efflux system outer membrane protein